ncbi:hypothetical protein BD770DRAFT_126198 [Pilaira anomala]|nr:hypothetical protein BD770DRAFT_126198 [Pilaira anomala]
MLRTLLNTRRSFHLSSASREEWTKASLRRMKKPELMSLGRENQLKLSGTKNEIIIQLLTHQTAKIVGVQTPASASIPKTKPQPAFGSLDTDSYPAADAAAAERVENDDLDQAWANAFEMKVAQRGSRKPKSDHPLSTTTHTPPHHFNKQIKLDTLLNPDDLTKPVPEIIGGFEPKHVIEVPEELEGMDPQWVEAFDLKVGSRGARSVLIDTLSPVTTSPSLSTLDGLDFVTIEKKVKDDDDKTVNKTSTQSESTESKPADESNPTEGKPTESKPTESKPTESKSTQTKPTPKSNPPTLETSVEKKIDHTKNTSEELNQTEKTTKDTITDNNNNNNISRGKFMNAAVGSSMILWYFGGEEGLRNVWNFLTSSS